MEGACGCRSVPSRCHVDRTKEVEGAVLQICHGHGANSYCIFRVCFPLLIGPFLKILPGTFSAIKENRNKIFQTYVLPRELEFYGIAKGNFNVFKELLF